MKNYPKRIKVALLMAFLFVSAQTKAPLRPIDEENIPLLFLPKLNPMTFVWPPFNARPAIISIVPFREAYQLETDTLTSAGKIVVFWLKPVFQRNPDCPMSWEGYAPQEGEAVLVPLHLICKEKLDLSEFEASSERVLIIKLYTDEQVVLPETMDNWRNIVGLNFIYFLIDEKTRIPWGEERRFPGPYLQKDSSLTDPIQALSYQKILDIYRSFWGTASSWGRRTK